MKVDPVERRRRAAATRAAAIASTPSTTRPGSETTDLRVGERVQAARTRASAGTWRRYDGRKGWVAAIYRQIFPTGSIYVEVGVSWVRPTDSRNPSVDAWFRADELVRA